MEVDIIQKQESGKKEVKRRFQLWIKPSTLALADKLYTEDNCESRSEFIEKAVIFYAGYLSAQNAQGYLPSVITSSVKAIVMEAVNRICGMLFKMSVGQIELMNVVAATHGIPDTDLDRLHGQCVEEAKRTNGNFEFKDAAKWQKG